MYMYMYSKYRLYTVFAVHTCVYNPEKAYSNRVHSARLLWAFEGLLTHV